jgi:hypothetical protein
MSNLAIEQLDLNPDNGGMGTGPSDILIPKVNDVFAKTTSLSLLDSLEPKEREEVEPASKESFEKPEPTTKSTFDIVEEISRLNGEEGGSSEDPEEGGKGRPKSDRNIMVNFLKGKIEAGHFETYADYDEKTPLSDYLSKMPEKDLVSLVDMNLEAQKEKEKTSLRNEVFESLPGSLQYVAHAVANGATEHDLQDIYSALLRVEQTRALDVTDETDQETIALTYLQATGFMDGNPQSIQEQVAEWKNDGRLEGKVKQFKPKLDQMQEEQVQYQLAQQEDMRRQQAELAAYYNDNVVNALRTGDLNGIKLDRKRQAEFYDMLTIVKPSPLSGKPVNALGAALERIQFSEEPDYKLLMEATWLLNNPDEYRNALMQMGKTKGAVEVEKKLKSAEVSRTQSQSYEEPEQPSIKKKGLLRQINPFKR